jgi:tetratricopeptide (TPR) repeat protein
LLHAATIALALALHVGCGRPQPAASPATRHAITEAEAALAARDYDAARAAYDRAIAQAPDDASRALARRERADARLFLGDLTGGAADLEALVALRPADAAAWHDLGVVRANAGDRPGAAAALTRAKALASDDPRPRLALAALRWADGDRAGARAEYQALLHLELPPRVRAKVEWAITELDPARAPR